jgi:membrane protease YdiL (CAAX protease family)/transcriptional regulator with XRE-family HTH domain
MNGRPPSAMRAAWLIALLSLRPWLNLLQGVRISRVVQGAETARFGTIPKSSSSGDFRKILLPFVLLLLFLSIFFMEFAGLATLSASSEELAGKIMVSPRTYSRLEATQQQFWMAGISTVQAVRLFNEEALDIFLDELFSYEAVDRPFVERDETISASEMQQAFREKGLYRFAADKAGNLNSLPSWPSEEGANSVFARSLAVTLLAWVLILVALPLGLGSKNLGQVDSSFEWLYTFPAPARALFASKLLGYSFFNGSAPLLLFPYFWLVFVVGGSGYGSAIPLGLASAIYLATLAGSIVLVAELALRKFLSLSTLKNIRASCTIFGTAAFFLFILMTAKPVADLLVRHVKALPGAVIWNPFSLPLLLAAPGAQAGQLRLTGLAMVAGLIVAPLLALYASDWLTRDGLVTAGGPYQGSRGGKSSVSRGAWLGGIAAHEITLLRRDRNLLAQACLLPLFLPVFYLVFNSRFFSTVMGSVRGAAVMAFAVAAYSYLGSAGLLLSREKKTLWYLLSFPRSLTSILLQKTQVWAAVGLLLGGGTLALLVHLNNHMRLSWGAGLMALYGIVLFAFIAAALGIVTTDLLKPGPQVQMNLGGSYSYMLLAWIYGATFYVNSIWEQSGQLVLCTLLTVALWQKVDDTCPFLLDPDKLPPRRINLADGMIAAFALGAVQSLMAIVLEYGSSLSPSAQTTVAYILAGLIVAIVALLVFWAQGVTDLWRTLGLDFWNQEHLRLPLRRYATGAVILGLAAASGGLAYDRVLTLLPQLQWKQWGHDEALKTFLAGASGSWWVWVLFVLAAPPVEEFIFRGLVFQGMRRVTGPALAILGSAALFALLHPPVAVIPVFGLGIAAAISFERSQVLWAPIITHAVYNTCVLILSRL